MVNFSQVVESMKGSSLILVNSQKQIRVIGEVGDVSVHGDTILAKVTPEPERIEEDPEFDLVATDGVVRITFLRSNKVEVVEHDEKSNSETDRPEE